MRKMSPPRWMDKIVEMYCRPELLEDLQGDLHECYDRNLKKGRFRANLIFFIDVIKFFRLYTVRKPKIVGQMTFFNLFKNYFKTSVRSIARNKLFSSINVVGLAISMSVGLLMITYLSKLLNYDSFHDKADRIYRVTTTQYGSDGTDELATTSVFIGKKIQEEYSNVENIVLIHRWYGSGIGFSSAEKTIRLRPVFANEAFFEAFSFQLLQGNPQTALSKPFSLILTEANAKKLFGEKNPMGKVVETEDGDFVVTGIIENIPYNSHMQFGMLASFSTVEGMWRKKQGSFFSRLMDWESITHNHVYVVLPEKNNNPQRLQRYLDKVAVEENNQNSQMTLDFSLQQITEITPGKKLRYQFGKSFDRKWIYSLVLLSIIIIVSACFNYTNLSIARTLRRTKEVGVRKVVGASQMQILAQFVFEAIIISMLALFISYGLYLLIRPFFMEMQSIGNMDVPMDFEWQHGVYFLVLALVIGLFAGFPSSVLLSKLGTSSIFHSIPKVRLFAGIGTFRMLVIFQFAIAVALIMGTTIFYRQYQHAIEMELGFSTENVVNVPLKGNDSETLINEFSRLPEITNISRSYLVPGADWIRAKWVKMNPDDSIRINVNYVDHNYQSIHNYEFLAGGSFSENVDDRASQYIIIDNELRKQFNFSNPNSAIGETIFIDEDNLRLKIVGVVSDFQYVQFDQGNFARPRGIIQGQDRNYNYVNLHISSKDVMSLMNKLESIWKKMDEIHPFEALFYDDQLEETYAELKVALNILGFLSFLSITISVLGLLGMVVYVTEIRLKEISLRKVMGASEKNLVMTLSRGFLLMLGMAALIATPLTYLLFDRLILTNFSSRITIGVLELLAGFFVIFSIGFFITAGQTFRAARTNPAKMLRDE